MTHETMTPPDDSALPIGIGRMEFDLLNDRGWRVETGEIILRRDTVDLWVANRIVTVMDRNLFREWLYHNSGGPLELDGVTWSVRECLTCLSIDRQPARSLPAATMHTLVVVI